MQVQSTVRKTTHHSRQPAQTENHAHRPRHRSHDDPIDDEGDDSNPEPSISNCCGPDGRVGNSRRRSRALGGGQGTATAAAEVPLDRIGRATLIAIESCVHGGHYKGGCESCKPESSALIPLRRPSPRFRTDSTQFLQSVTKHSKSRAFTVAAITRSLGFSFTPTA